MYAQTNLPFKIIGDGTKYTFLEKIGEGSYGVVGEYLSNTGETVAIKMVKQKHKSTADEINILEKIKSVCSEGLLCLIEIIKDRDVLYIVTEYINGINLEEYMQSYKKIIDEKYGNNFEMYEEMLMKIIKIILKAISRGIEILSELNIIHRDIKMENIIIDGNNKINLIDYGLSCIDAECRDIVGTPYYIAPELILGNKFNKANVSTEIYSLGVIAYYVYTGEFPLDTLGYHLNKINLSVYKQTYANNNNVTFESLSPNMNELVNSMLNRNPALRPTPEAVIMAVDKM